jgi:uncharacterized tellurite resistance protein B-like protein
MVPDMQANERIALIADLLMGAAYADQKLEGKEEAAVRRLLGELVGNAGGILPSELDGRIRKFKAAGFKVADAAKPFAGEPTAEKRKLLELVAAVHAADEELDLDEDRYLKDLGAALGLQPADYKDLALELEIEDLKGHVSALTK